MQLQGRNLSLTTNGEDVKLLQQKLRQLGFSIDDTEGFFDKTTFQAVHALQKEHGLPATGVVDETTAKLIGTRGDALQPKAEPAGNVKDGLKQFVVKGQIRLADGSPLVGAIVRAFDKDLRSEERLNETKTDKDGHYEITYTSAQFRRAEKGSADLIVRVFNTSGSPLAASPIIFNARPEETVDLVIRAEEYRGSSEYERLFEELTPLLEDIEIEGIERPTLIDKIADLKEDEGHQEITFLAGETGKDLQHISFLVLAAVLAKETGGALDGSTKINSVLPEAFYGLFRQNLPTDFPSLLAYPSQVLRGALENALRANIIPAKLSNQIDSIIEGLKEQAVEQALRSADDKGRASLGDLLSSSLLAKEEQKTFLKLYLTHKGPVEGFWKALGEHPQFKDHVDGLQFTFQVSALTQNYLPLIRELQQMRQAGSLKSPRDLAKLDAQAWLELANKKIDDKPVGFPPDIEGKDDQEKARAMARVIEATFPTAAFAHQIETDSSTGAPFKAQEKEDLLKFFANNPDFAFDTAPISSYLSKNPNTIRDVKDAETLTKHLSSIQRLSRLTPYYEEWRPLLADQLHSAHSIVSRWGRTEFATKFGQHMGEERAKAIYDQADHRVATTTVLYAKYAAAFNSVGLYVTPKLPTDVAEIPDWRTLFGGLDVCECEHCRSVYSPPAYLVDMLSFLRRLTVVDANGTDTGKKAKDILFERRPDIGEIELSCENTDTAMPYVDLVNEVLEQVVPPPQPPLTIPAPTLPGPPVPRPPSLPIPARPGPAATSSIVAYQTSDTAEELSANPEHFKVQAYETLAQQVYPWDLPFNLWIEEARAYLEHLGVQRYELMETFHKEAPPSELTNIAIASEYLGLTTVEREIISGVSPKGPWEFWGLDKTDAIPDPADNTNTIQGSWIDILSRVHVFLKRSGLAYKELLDLLDTKFINANRALRIDTLASVKPEDRDTCDPGKLVIVPLNQTALGRMQHFIRLWRKLGWTMDELDQAITALIQGDLNPTFLLQLSHIQRLRSQLMVPLINMLSWWAPIDTASYSDGSKSFYEQLFLNKTVTDPVDDAFTLDKLANNSGKISEHIPALLAALGISEADLSLLTRSDAVPTTLNLAESEIKDDMLNLANLSQLYRIVSFAKALKLSIRDFLLVKTLTGINPFDAAHTQDTLMFVEKVRKIRVSGFTIAELDYLLRDHVVPPSGIAPTEESIALVLEEIRSGLQKIATENNSTADPPDPAVELTRRTSSESFVKQKLSAALKLEGAATELLLVTLLNSPNDPTKLSIFLQDSFITSITSKKTLSATEFPPQFQAFILLAKTATIISKFKLLAEELRWILVHAASLTLLDLSALPVGVAASPAALFAGWERLVDVIDLLRGLPQLRDTLSSNEWQQLKVPFGLTDDAVAVLSNEPALMAVFDLVARFNGANTADAETELWQILSERTGWNRDDLVFLAGDQGLGFTFPDAYKDERALKRLRACFVILKRLGVSAAKVLEKNFAWTQPDVTSEVSRRIKQSVKAKYDDDQWLEVAKPLRDISREKQRSSLVSYLVAHPDPSKGQDWRDSNGLYEHFLIDVEMDPCMITSRIKQAISSVQLFVQRCLMNLEKEQVVFTPEDVREWKWMKNYRVWEANRKVFLYPENWIEPELRDNKSPFFKDLENELLQNEITKDSVEEAFAHYLEKLDEVARLEICGMYYQFEPYGDDHNLVVHVFGRTPGNPHMYYYRQWVDLAYWTAWEKVEVDIEGDHLIPVVYNRRLRIYWPIFTEKADENQPIPDQNATAEEKKPIKHWEIKLAWSEYKNGKWSAKKVSIDTLESPRELLYERNGKRIDNPNVFALASAEPNLVVERNDTSLFTFKGLIINPDDPNEYLAIRCYAPDIHFIPHAGAGGEELLYSPKSGWWPIGEFRLEGCNDEPLSFLFSGDKPLVAPPRSTIRNMMLVEDQEQEDVEGADDGLYILTNPANDTGDLILGKTPGIFRLLYPHQIESFMTPLFFYQDKAKTFFVIPKPNGRGSILKIGLRLSFSLLFEMFYHPYVCEFIKQFNRYGVDGLLDPGSYGEESWPPRQLISHEFFDASYEPDWVQPQLVDQPYPKEEVDFSYGGSYSLYNWELFFQAPLLIADRLSKNQRFEEAQQWFHYIFDPTAHFSQSELNGFRDKDPSARFWKVRAFFENADVKKTIEELLKLLDYKGTDPDQLKRRKEFEHEVTQWQKNPFNPHLIARNRITAYQKTVVMKYIDNLIAWGDQLFRRDTIEAINEATQIYILAAEILGDRPQDIPPRLTVQAYTYNQLEPELDGFSNVLVQVENLLPPPATGRLLPNPAFGVKPPSFNPFPSFPLPSRKDKGSMKLPPTFYFCISKNDNLLGYWDTVADRLFKIRHCMNIEGVVRELPLFEPPIDPALLVRAVAAGIDISSALNDLSAALPHYRFGTMLQKAVELCNDVKALGSALLSALEKRDAEALALLRSSNEISLLKAVRQVKEKQIEEAKDALEGLNKAWEIANERYNYYSSREFMNAAEIANTTLTSAALISQTIGIALDAYAGVAHLAPAGTAGASGMSSPVVTMTYGGLNIGNGASSWADAARGTAAVLHTGASLSSAIAAYQRRADDWDLQKKLADKERDQITQQVAAAEIRKAIAEKELENQDLQIENAQSVDSYMHDKFTNQELYDWMVGQIAATYFQSYQLAYDVTKRAERAYHFELDLADANFIQFGYWDSLKKGLLAGEKLHYDLKRMEMAYLDQHKREYEITKHISLLALDPVALVKLKETGECLVDLPEALFDLDYPGHYMRRIKSVGLTIPCVTGPYTSVNCTLTLLKNSVRKNTSPGSQYGRNIDSGVFQDDDRFKDSVGAIQSIVTSSAQNDSGLFETNLRDERYLPFEGAGAISEWRIELSQDKDFRQFDYNTISDIILHLRYTARDGGGILKGKAIEELRTILSGATLQLAEKRKGLFRLFSAKHEFPNDWYRFLRPKEDQTDQSLQVNLDKERFPFQFRDETITITTVEFFLKLKGLSQDSLASIGTIPLTLLQGTTLIKDMELRSEPTLGGLYHAEVELNEAQVPVVWSIAAKEDKISSTLVDDVAGQKRLKPDAIDDLVIVCHYTVQNEGA